MTGKLSLTKSCEEARLVLQIAHHISTGTPLWDRRVSRHAVLYLCLEDTLQRIQSRLLTVCDGETGDVTFSIEAGILGDGFEKQLIAYLRSHADTKVVIVDTLAKVRGAVSSSNVYSSDYAAMNVFKHLADTFRIALILVHHTRKQDAEDAMQTMSSPRPGGVQLYASGTEDAFRTARSGADQDDGH